MLLELFRVLVEVILPVFGVVVVGFLAGPRLGLQAGTLTRSAYFVFVPAFIFRVISHTEVSLATAARMIGFIVLAQVVAALAAGGLGRLLGRSRELIAAFVMAAVFGNVGNFGLAAIHFRLGDAALGPATLYSVVITLAAFVICVGAAGWARGGGAGAVAGVLRTPALWAMVPALAVSGFDLSVPLFAERLIGLLADAMIPVMLFALGVQIHEQKRIFVNRDVLTACGLRLLLAPLVAWGVVGWFGLSELQAASGILQAGMPTAILVSIIAREHDLLPAFATSVVVVSTLLCLASLSLLMVLV